MSRTKSFLSISILGLAAFVALPFSEVGAQQPATQLSPVPADPALIKDLTWRSIGPDRGGRSIAVSGVKGRPNEAYFGATGGGLWKTTNAGVDWTPVTDGKITSASVGAVAVAESNPDVVFIGTGESCIRGNIMPGDGVYKSANAGATWTKVGFETSQAISKIRIHPTNADIVYVASFGKYGVPSDDRGVFKSTDGGRTWKKTLFRDNKTGAVDLSIDRNNPNVIYAALWEAFRIEYTMSSGGPGSGLFKSTDGGDTWTEITRNPGMPGGMIGRIGVSVSGADSNRVYALVENDKGGLFVSDNAGATWTLVNENRNIRQRAFYYTHVAADPKDKNLVYLLNVSAYRSTDGGKTLSPLGGGQTHGDYHDLWIDPETPAHLVVGNDGGGAVQAAGGQWTPQDYPTPQYYHAATTKHIPYHVCGAQQDGSTVCLPNEAGGGRGGRGGGRGGAPAAPVMYSPGGSEDGAIAPDPKDVDVFFSGANNGGFLERINRRTGENREVHPYPRMFSGEPASAIPERVQWTYPIVFSPVDPNVLFTATQHVWRTTSQGQNWDRISGDLTRHDPKTLAHSGGPITGDMNGPEIYATVFALGPSKVDVNVLWAGSDDGLVHVTQNGGKTWANVTPKEMPDFGRVSIIDASAFDAGTAYVAVKRMLFDDEKPYIFRTHDFGKTWTKIVNGLGPTDYVHVVREDPTRQGLLYAGTQHKVYYSYDDGANWHSLSLNLPDVPMKDLVVETHDLVLATHGRGFYILDDIFPLRQSSPAVTSTTDVFLFKPEEAMRSTNGAQIRYLVKGNVDAINVQIVDAKGTVVRTFGAAPPAEAGDPGRAGGAGAGGGGGRGGRGGGAAFAPTTPGMQTINWDLRYPPASSFPGMILWGGGVQGPAAAPGTYTVKLTANGRTQTQTFVVKRNHLFRDVTDADLQAQFDLAIQIRDSTSEANDAVIRIRDLKAQIADRLSKSNGDARLKSASEALSEDLSSVEEAIYQVKNQSGQDPLNFPIKINNRLASLLSVVNTGDGRPIGNALPIFNSLKADLKVQTDKLKATDRQIAAFNAEAKRLGLDPIK
ncbi:MAG TPA: hypothetical protein VFV98_07550 [Vicinamibacterales bacterium]|nr:hypothetical protein [Vicinamibacterales bacterium]